MLVDDELTNINKECKPLTSKDDKIFRYNMPGRQCVYRFLAKAAGPEKWHRITTLGYEKILIREK